MPPKKKVGKAKNGASKTKDGGGTTSKDEEQRARELRSSVSDHLCAQYYFTGLMRTPLMIF